MKVKNITFKQLWENHPTQTDDDNPCSTDEKPNFSNQCAIRLGVCLARCGVDTTKIPKVVHCSQHKKSEGHILRAEELAMGLTKSAIVGILKMQKVDPKKFEKELDGKTGIIFFKDYWQRNNQSFENRSGDHIDLWNRTRLTDWATWIRIQAGLTFFGALGSDFKQSKEIWFWRVN